jgi:hypothetical protein
MSFLSLAKRFPTFDTHFDNGTFPHPSSKLRNGCLGLGREGQDG